MSEIGSAYPSATRKLLDAPLRRELPAPRCEIAGLVHLPVADGVVHVAGLDHLRTIPQWQEAFAQQRKDYRYYEIVQQTILQGFQYQYFVLVDNEGKVQAIQPFFLLRQDLLQGSGARIAAIAAAVRRWFPRFLTLRTLMVGCAAGEGHLDRGSHEYGWVAATLHEALLRYARIARAPMVVLKEFPAQYRDALSVFAQNGYTRVPSLPSIRLHLPYDSFEQYMSEALSKATRKDLRRKFRAAKDAGITMQVARDISPWIDELYPLYLQVFGRSKLHFEKLTPQYLCELGRRMPDKMRFFIWRMQGRAIAFSICMVNGDEIHDEYLGMDYAVALELSLYFYTLRDVLQWAMENGYRWYYSTALGYEPKLHLKCELAPLDLYVAHTWGPANWLLRRVLPWIEPTHNDKTLAKFPNAAELWGER